MAGLLDDVAYLSQEIGPRPAGTEEEQQAALYIADCVHKQTRLRAEIEDISCSSSLGLAKVIYFTLAFVAVVVPLCAPVVGLPGFILAVLACAAYLCEELWEKPLLSRMLARDISQNIITKYRPASLRHPGASKRKIIVVANYDSGKVERELNGSLARFMGPLLYASNIAMVAAPVIGLLKDIIFVNGINFITLFLFVAGIVDAVLLAIPLILFLLHRFSPYNEAANCNASGVAALLELARRVSENDRVDLLQEEKAPAAEPVIHGEDAVRAAGIVDASIDLSYDDGVAVTETVDVTASPRGHRVSQEHLVPETIVAVETAARGATTEGSATMQGSAQVSDAVDSSSFDIDPVQYARKLRARHEDSLVEEIGERVIDANTDQGAAEFYAAEASLDNEEAYIDQQENLIAQGRWDAAGAEDRASYSEESRAGYSAEFASREFIEDHNRDETDWGVQADSAAQLDERAQANEYESSYELSWQGSELPESSSAEERLSAAKEAIALLTGKPLRSYSSQHKSPEPTVQINREEIDTPTDDELANRRAEIRSALSGTAESTIAEPDSSANRVQDAVVEVAREEAKSADDASATTSQIGPSQEPVASSAFRMKEEEADVPDWYRKAQLKANKQEPSRPVHRSRYAEALDQAVSQSSVYFEQANQLIDKETEERLRMMQQGITEVKPPTFASDEAPKSAREHNAKDRNAQKRHTGKQSSSLKTSADEPEQLTRTSDQQMSPHTGTALSVREAAIIKPPMAAPENQDELLIQPADESPRSPRDSYASQPAVSMDLEAKLQLEAADDRQVRVRQPAQTAPRTNRQVREDVVVEEITVTQPDVRRAPSFRSFYPDTEGARRRAAQQPTKARQSVAQSSFEEAGRTTAMPPIDTSQLRGSLIDIQQDMPSVKQNSSEPRRGRGTLFDGVAQHPAPQPHLITGSSIEPRAVGLSGPTSDEPSVYEDLELPDEAQVGVVARPTFPTREIRAAEEEDRIPTDSFQPVASQDGSHAPAASHQASGIQRDPNFREGASRVVLPDVPEHDPIIASRPEAVNQRAPLAQATAVDGKAAAKSLLSHRIPKINASDLSGDLGEPVGSEHSESLTVAEKRVNLIDHLPSLSGAIGVKEGGEKAVSATGSFAAIVTPVGDELVADVDPDEVYVDDADDSAYEGKMTESGAYAGPDYVRMPKKRSKGLLGRFRRKKNEPDDISAQEWLEVDEDFDARTVGKERGDWASFQEDSDYNVQQRRRKSPELSDEFDIDWDEGQYDWRGGAFSNRRSISYDDEPNEVNLTEAEFVVEQQSLSDSRKNSKEGQERHGGVSGLVHRVGGGITGVKDKIPFLNRENKAQESHARREGRRRSEGARSTRDQQRRSSEHKTARDHRASATSVRTAGERQRANSARSPMLEAELREVQEFQAATGVYNTEIWFVALGAELSDNAGMKAFLAAHGGELRGSLIISIEALGAGHLCGITREGSFKRFAPSTRLKRFLRNASQLSGVPAGQAEILWRTGSASYAISRGFQGITIAGMDGDKPALYGQSDDVLENIDEGKLQDNVEFILALLRTI